MDTILPTQIQLLQGLSHPFRIRGHLKLRYMDITVKQATFVKRAFLSMHLRLNVTRAQILYEQSFKRNTAMLDPTREDDQDDDD